MGWIMLLIIAASMSVAFMYAGLYYATACRKYATDQDSFMYYSEKHYHWFSFVLGVHVCFFGYKLLTINLVPFKTEHFTVELFMLLFIMLILGLTIRECSKHLLTLKDMKISSFYGNLYRVPQDDDLTIGMEDCYNHRERAWVVFLLWLWDTALCLSWGALTAVFIQVPGMWKAAVLILVIYFSIHAGKSLTGVIRWRMRAVTFL